ncbi:MAG: hypothetical protein IIC50_19310 [Planctomycetes bacterium]|nr:hypothetical protein [Planctomycetota bacterium]
MSDVILDAPPQLQTDDSEGDLENHEGTTIKGFRGSEIGKFVSRYGKPLTSYCLDSQSLGQPGELEKVPDDKGIPPFVVVGLGRCGCHVSAELAEILAANHPDQHGRRNVSPTSSWVSTLFGQRGSIPMLQFQPIMLIGDIDETTFEDVDGLLRQGGVSDAIRKEILKLRYHPLAEGGVGHVPIFAEFISRGLFLLPELDQAEKPLWSTARGLLLNFSTKHEQVPRLVFYVFSTGGGTGAGGAAEIMRAQSYAKTVLDIDREMYFTGIGILPTDIGRDQTQLINTGRTLVRYLADLNIRLEDPSNYGWAPTCQASSFVEVAGQDEGDTDSDDTFSTEKRPIMPWNSMALISNDVMTTSANQIMTFDEAESNANQYIAQQIFNLAAAQFPAAEFEKDKDASLITKKNYQEIRLDPNDLKAGLIGPYAVAFAASPTEITTDQDVHVVDDLFVRALSLPSQHITEGSKGSRLIEGLSIAPHAKEEYRNILAGIKQRIDSEEHGALTEESLAELRNIQFFERCPRIVFSLAAPQKSDIPNVYKERLSQLIDWAFPNLIQTRSAISWGTTSYFALSIFIETSVLLVPDVQMALINYLRLCWKQRSSDLHEFVTTYKQFRAQDPPISEEAVREWLGDKENYGVNIPNFDAVRAEHDRKWGHYVQRYCTKPKRKKELMEHRVSNCFINYKEATAAIRYLNYAYRVMRPKTIVDADMLL